MELKKPSFACIHHRSPFMFARWPDSPPGTRLIRPTLQPQRAISDVVFTNVLHNHKLPPGPSLSGELTGCASGRLFHPAANAHTPPVRLAPCPS
jgi:hypothetical protein